MELRGVESVKGAGLVTLRFQFSPGLAAVFAEEGCCVFILESIHRCQAILVFRIHIGTCSQLLFDGFEIAACGSVHQCAICLCDWFFGSWFNGLWLNFCNRFNGLRFNWRRCRLHRLS